MSTPPGPRGDDYDSDPDMREIHAAIDRAQAARPAAARAGFEALGSVMMAGRAFRPRTFQTAPGALGLCGVSERGNRDVSIDYGI